MAVRVKVECKLNLKHVRGKTAEEVMQKLESFAKSAKAAPKNYVTRKLTLTVEDTYNTWDLKDAINILHREEQGIQTPSTEKIVNLRKKDDEMRRLSENDDGEVQLVE